MGKIVRISVPIDEEVNEKLKTIMPWGVKAQVVRELLLLLIETQKSTNSYVIQDLLKGKCELRCSKFE